MKWQFAIAALALVWPSAARVFRATDHSPVEAENEGLKKKIRHLEAMMQVARSEVHRMDLAVESRRQGNDNGGDHADVVNQEIDDLRKKLQSVEADKKSLVQTLRQMLKKNSTQIFRTQAENALRAKEAVEMKCNQERGALQAQIKEASGRVDETKEMTQTLQEQGLDLQKTVRDLREKLAASEKNAEALAIDKANLVETMHSLMRESTKFKKEFEAETQKETTTAQELAAEEAKVAKLAKVKKAPKQAKVAKKEVRKTSSPKAAKAAPLHLNHEESMASKIAKMNHINRYIDRANYATDDSSDNASDQATATKDDRLVDEMQKEEDVFEKGKLAKGTADSPKDLAEASELMGENRGLGDWLGLKAAPVKTAAAGAIHKDANGLSPIDALDPEAVKVDKAKEAKKRKDDADDGGDGIENLLAQAKDQLSAMDVAEASNSA